MVHFASFALSFFLFISTVLAYTGTALDTYVNTPDPAYSYELVNSTISEAYTLYYLRMTSQTWQTPEFSDHYIWRHSMWVCVPQVVKFNTHGFLFINAGDDTNDQLNGDGLEALFLDFCATSGAISTMLFQIPNQPIKFPDSGPLYEDAIIAHTFRSFLNSSGANPSQILHFPMTKACVRALDTVQHFTRNRTPTRYNLMTFCVTGASKRGWATWLHAAVDSRITSAVPIVIPILNTKANILSQKQNLGEWGWALDDYTAQHIFDYAGTPQFDALMSHVDPLSYNNRYFRMPKLVVTGTLDQFFLLDAPKYFWNQLQGVKFLAEVPNADHSFTTPGSGERLFELLVAFFLSTAQGVQLPTLTWQKVLSNSTNTIPRIQVTTNSAAQVVDANMWQITTTRPGFRDFRLNPCPDTSNCFSYLVNGVFYTPTPLYPTSVNDNNVATYEGNITNLLIAQNKAEQRWTAFFVELTYEITLPGGVKVNFTLTSEPNIFPDFYPFPAHVSDYAAIGMCNLTVSFEHSLTNAWSDGKNNYSSWTVKILPTHELYAAQIEVNGPLTSLWGLTPVSGAIYKIPDYQYQNGVIPAGTNTIQFGYITKSTQPARVSLVNNAGTNACYPRRSPTCSVSVTPTVTNQWQEGGSQFQSITLTVKNINNEVAANTRIEIGLLNNAVLTQTWNLSPYSTTNATTTVYTCPLYNLQKGQTSTACGYIIKSPTPPPTASVSHVQTICV